MKPLLVLLLSAAALAQETPPPDFDQMAKDAAAKGESAATGVILGSEDRSVEGAVVVELDLPAATIQPFVAWSLDKGAFFVADKGGMIRRITISTLIEQRRFWAGEPVPAMIVSKLGLVILRPTKSEIVLLDEDTLAVKQTTRIGGSKSMTLGWHPKEPWAYVVGGDRLPTQVEPVDLSIFHVAPAIQALDVMKAQSQKLTIRRHPQGMQLSTFEAAAATPNGDSIFFASGDTAHRFRMMGRDLIYEECGPKVGSIGWFAISPDSKLIAMPGSDKAPPEHPSVSAGGTWVYRTDNLQKPTLGLLRCRAYGFARLSGKVVGTRDPDRAGIFSNQGKLEKSFAIPGGVEAVKLLEIEHNTGKILLLTGDKLWWVSFK